ncbi:hypothetical protein [Streptomyces sp. NPDC005262]|uniref:hypothetical protein n=1 Tax=Streptomyces sp. NPDC005262 TaxID=3364710 RepID=UPI0036802704
MLLLAATLLLLLLFLAALLLLLLRLLFGLLLLFLRVLLLLLAGAGWCWLVLACTASSTAMDPTILAAIIPTPVAVIAAAAAYAAGRSQARGAHQGPIDAVRRQHQRDAYAAFLHAANVYTEATNWERCKDQAREDLRAAGQRHTTELVESEACSLVMSASREQLTVAGAVVDLEGPEHIAVLAGEVTRAASYVEAAAVHHGLVVPSDAGYDEERDEVDGTHRVLRRAIHAFTPAARKYLNDGRIT